MQQLHGFGESRNDQKAIQNRNSKIKTSVVSLYLSASYFSFRFLPLAKIIEQIENGKNRVFLVVPIEVKITSGTHFYLLKVRNGLELYVETIPMRIVCLHLEIFCSEPSAPIYGTLKSRYICFFKVQKLPRNYNQSAYLFIVVPNDRLIVLPFYETMELLHV
jgi:hypothetical protein